MSQTDGLGGGPANSVWRAYIRKRGRMTRGQARALEELSARYLIPDGTAAIDTSTGFGRPPVVLGEPSVVAGRQPAGPLGLEIGFGMGHALLEWARQRPDWNLLGVEIYEPGVGAALLGLERDGLEHVRLVQAPAEHVLERLGQGVLDEVRIFFPDPWPKARHHKRRLVQAEFVRLLADRMGDGALLWLATDWEDYAQWLVEILDAEPALSRLAEPRVTTATVDDRPRTRFEARGIKLGHRLWDLRYRRNPSNTPSR